METKDFKTRNEIRHQAFPCPEKHWVIGLDIGYSGVKCMAPNKIFCIPAYAKQIPKDRVFLGDVNDMDIHYKDDEIGYWVVGRMAYTEVVASEVVDSEAELFGRNRYYSDMFKVIARTGIALGLMGNQFGNSDGKKLTLQTGLPPKYMDKDKHYLREVLSGTHKFSIKLGNAPWQHYEFSLSENDIRVMPQPLGALVSASIDAEGRPLPDAKKYFSNNIIVFDPGFGTTDDYVVKQGNVVGYNTFSNLGMREVFARTCEQIKKVYGESIEIPELQNHLDSGEIRILDKRHMKRITKSFAVLMEDSCKKVCEETIERMKSVHDFFSDVDYIIAAGGTYDAWREQFNEVFKDMEGLTIVPANINDSSLSNIYSNVRGYYYQCINSLR